MTLRSMLSPAVEDYLKAIYKLQIEHPETSAGGGATTNAIAKASPSNAARSGRFGIGWGCET